MMNLLFIKSSMPALSKSVFLRFEIAWLTLLLILLMINGRSGERGEVEGRNTRNTTEARATTQAPNKQQASARPRNVEGGMKVFLFSTFILTFTPANWFALWFGIHWIGVYYVYVCRVDKVAGWIVYVVGSYDLIQGAVYINLRCCVILWGVAYHYELLRIAAKLCVLFACCVWNDTRCLIWELNLSQDNGG